MGNYEERSPRSFNGMTGQSSIDDERPLEEIAPTALRRAIVLVDLDLRMLNSEVRSLRKGRAEREEVVDRLKREKEKLEERVAVLERAKPQVVADLEIADVAIDLLVSDLVGGAGELAEPKGVSVRERYLAAARRKLT